mmetsp:Transcript_22229/g.37751  ORF Transcript_22229/g.37751 Transcript_22229/m.37751 type:complete len:91 (+) Transcript_22229:2868-3140(+)
MARFDFLVPSAPSVVSPVVATMAIADLPSILSHMRKPRRNISEDKTRPIHTHIAGEATGDGCSKGAIVGGRVDPAIEIDSGTLSGLGADG